MYGMQIDTIKLSLQRYRTAYLAAEEQKKNPENYLGPIDKAINYVLDQSTQLGSYMTELRFTADNLVTAQENTTSAESTIRDADMILVMRDGEIVERGTHDALYAADGVYRKLCDMQHQK